MSHIIDIIMDISLEEIEDLPNTGRHADDIIHEFVPVHSFNFELPVAQHALLCVALFAPQAVVVPARDDGHRVLQLMAVGTLDLWHDVLVDLHQVH